jgi:hypothetical protein
MADHESRDGPDADPRARRAARARGWAAAAGWRGLVRDVTLIVLGAALALGAEEWRDAREQRHRVELALAGIRAELRANQQAVERARDRHRRVRDTLRAYAARAEAPPLAVCAGGAVGPVFAPALPLATAWQAARETGAVATMPYATVLALGRVYEQQTRYRALGDALTQAINVDYQREGLAPYMRARCANFAVLEEDFANREGALADLYAAALREVGAPAGGGR